MKLRRSSRKSMSSQSKKQPAFKDTIKRILKKTSKVFQKRSTADQSQQSNMTADTKQSSLEKDVVAQKNGPATENNASVKIHNASSSSSSASSSYSTSSTTSSTKSSSTVDNVMQKKTKNTWVKKSFDTSAGSNEVQVAFFCSNEKYFNQCDDIEMIQMIQVKYPNFMRYDTNDVETKKTLIALFQDKPFVDEFLKFYNISIQEFFKFIFRNEMSVFKGPYISKVSKILKDTGYEV